MADTACIGLEQQASKRLLCGKLGRQVIFVSAQVNLGDGPGAVPTKHVDLSWSRSTTFDSQGSAALLACSLPDGEYIQFQSGMPARAVRDARAVALQVGIDSPNSLWKSSTMHSLLKADSRDALWHRISTLRPHTTARWGDFTAPRMVAHLIQSLRMMSGDLPIPPEPAPWVLSHAPLKHLLIYVLPFPKGMSTFPELLARPAPEPQSITESGWADEQRAFKEALDAVGEKDPAGKWPDHGAFGPLTGREWGVLQYRHLDHHLRQFGC